MPSTFQRPSHNPAKGLISKLPTTFDNVEADVLALKDMGLRLLWRSERTARRRRHEFSGSAFRKKTLIPDSVFFHEAGAPTLVKCHQARMPAS